MVTAGRIMIADFSGAQVPPVVRYWESWGEHPLFNGWQDDNDWAFAVTSCDGVMTSCCRSTATEAVGASWSPTSHLVERQQ
jgi:hypothetical protein